jgi:drug/metabolite transporter (DMT)-like permease
MRPVAVRRSSDVAHNGAVAAALPLALFVVLWSSGYVVGALGVEAAPPLGVLALRFALALVLAVPLALRVPGWRRAPFGRLAVIGLLLQGVQFAGVFGGLALGVPAALSALVVLGLAPVATTAMAALSGMERPDGRTWTALAVGVGGVALSLVPELEGARVGAGVSLTVLGMLGLSLATVLQKRWGEDADTRVSVAVQLGVASLVIAPLAALTGQLHPRPTLQLGFAVAWLAWPLSVGAVGLFIWLLRRHQASTVSSLLLIVPAVTAILAVPVLGQHLPLMSVIGMPITLGAVFTVVRRAYARPAPDVNTTGEPRTGERVPPRSGSQPASSRS